MNAHKHKHEPHWTGPRVRLVFRLWTGPVESVQAVFRDRLQSAGLDVLVQGTEHVHVRTSPEPWTAGLRKGFNGGPDWRHSHGLSELHEAVRTSGLGRYLERDGLDFLRFDSEHDCRECGRAVKPGPVNGESGASGYGIEADSGRLLCYGCASVLGCSALVEHGSGCLYLVPKTAPAGWIVQDWTGTWTAPAFDVHRGSIGGCVDGYRDSFRFIGPDGLPWTGTRAGDMDLCRVRRLKPGGRAARDALRTARARLGLSGCSWILDSDGKPTPHYFDGGNS